MGALHRKKLCRFNEPGHAHELTFSCYQRLPLLSRDRSRSWVVQAIDQARTALDYSLLCYVIMPEHVHLIVQPNKPDYNISHFLKRLKQSVSRKAKGWLIEEKQFEWLQRLTVIKKGSRPEFRFWQAGGGYDRNIVDLTTLSLMMKYIHNNPVRRGLVAVPADWQWSSAAGYEGLAEDPLMIDRRPW